tara:strand:+ start:655 stop:834 length:180 start_codon:yes stop_codon:yes gene_type:complete
MKFQERVAKAGGAKSTIFQTVDSSNPAQQQDFDLECDLQLDDLDDNKILTQNYTSDLQN